MPAVGFLGCCMRAKLPTQYNSTYVVVDPYASCSCERESGRHKSHPEYVYRDHDRIVQVGVVENERVQKDDEAAELATERGGVGKHEAVVNLTDGHRDLLMLLSDHLYVGVSDLTMLTLQTSIQLLVDTLEPIAEELRQ